MFIKYKINQNRKTDLFIRLFIPTNYKMNKFYNFYKKQKYKPIKQKKVLIIKVYLLLKTLDVYGEVSKIKLLLKLNN